MKVIFNSINTNSAGTSNITKTALNQCKSVNHDEYICYVEDNKFFKDVNSNNFTVKKVNFGSGIKRLFNRFLFDFFIFPSICKKQKPDAVVILANYSPVPLKAKKIVLMRHPYLVDDNAWKLIKTRKHYLIEVIRGLMFKLTLLSTDKVVLQTDAMYSMFKVKYPWFKGELVKIANPISNDILSLRESKITSLEQREKILFYPSRYYSHKNHEFIINLAVERSDFFRENNIKFIITLDENGEASHLLDLIRIHNVDDIIVNLGEVQQSELFYYYKNSLMLFFPSLAETFGNSIVEAMCCSLPIVISKKDYAETLCLDSAIYLSGKNLDQAVHSINKCVERWPELSELVHTKSYSFFDSDEWVFRILNMKED